MELISVGNEDTKYLINRFVLQECGDFTWRMSGFEELVGVTHRRCCGWFWGIHFFNTPLSQFTNGFSQLWNTVFEFHLLKVHGCIF